MNSQIDNKLKTNKSCLLIVTIAILLMIFVGSKMFAQSHDKGQLALSIQQDLRFATIGDKKRGYDAFTLDVLIRFKMKGNNYGNGYVTVFPELEIANIEGKYYRYSANVGYTFTDVYWHNLEISPYIGYGYIDRYKKNFSSFGGGVEVGFAFNDTFKFVNTLQATQRNDLKWLWGTNKLGISYFIGIEINIR